MKTKTYLFSLLVVVAILAFSCKKSELDTAQCFRGKVLPFREYCENTFLVQLASNSKGIGKTVEYEGQTFYNVIKIAGGNFTLYDDFGSDGTLFFKLRTYDVEADIELVAIACTAVLPSALRFQHVPIYVTTAVDIAQCP